MRPDNLLKRISLTAAIFALAALPAFHAAGAVASARPVILDLRPLTPQEITDYKLTGAQVASGLTTIGVGQPAHLEVTVDSHAAEVQDVTWTLLSKPIGSAAALEPSPLGASIPLWDPFQREVDRLVGRMFLRPDMAGQYTVEARVVYGTNVTTVSKTITAGTYLGISSCTYCHSGSQVLPDQVTPFNQTRHASFFTRAIDGQASDHYASYCISCHTVGFDTNTNAVNGGFDDIAKKYGWTFPAHPTNGVWAAMPAELQDVSNIQCENCHGPGSEHAWAAVQGDAPKAKIAVNLTAGSCSQCHDSKPYHTRSMEWQNSRHAVATLAPTGEGREGCVRCHSAYGYVEYASYGSVSRGNTTYEPISCAACHDPHSATNAHQLRVKGPIVLLDGTEVEDPGTGAVCMSCHLARRNAEQYVETTTGGSTFGPHHSNQADMLAGANAIHYGKAIPSSAHAKVVEDSCATCHMQAVAINGPGFTKVGGHTFRLSYDGGTPSDPSDDVHMTAACAECHGEVEGFNFKRADYDGNGVVEGVQDEVKGLLAKLAYLLPPVGVAKDTIAINNKWTKQQLRAGYNWRFVGEEGSFGVHNTAYAVGLLKASIADMKDDGDEDGVSDKWEIAKFGSITAYDGNADPDNDGVSNALEAAAGTNPMLADSDGDGIPDMVELQAGSDPMNATDTPGFIVKMYDAAEIEFYAETGKTYQIQKCSELTGTWSNWGDPVVGANGMVTRLTSTRADEKAYFRVKAQ